MRKGTPLSAQTDRSNWVLLWRVGSISFGRNGGLDDCISTAHPSLLEKCEIEAVTVPVQILAPEFDPIFTDFDDGCLRCEIMMRYQGGFQKRRSQNLVTGV